MHELKVLAHEIEDALGWNRTRFDYAYAIAKIYQDERDDCGVQIRYLPQTNRERLLVRGIYPGGPTTPDWKRYGEQAPEITVAFNRGAATIAREIERRLLPDYYPAYTRALDAHTSHVAYTEATLETARQLAEMGAKLRGETEAYFRGEFIDVRHGAGKINEIKIRAYLPVEAVEQIRTIVNKHSLEVTK